MALKAANGAIRDIVGYQFEPRAEGAPAFGGGDLVLPAKVDLRPTLSPVEQQGSTQSCVAQAVAGAYEYLVRRHRGLDAYEVSRLFIYYNARATGAQPVADAGSSMQRAILGLQAHGACSEESWPFEAAAVNEKPHAGAYDEAGRFVIEGAEHVRTDLRLWKQALAQGHPILFALKIYQSFDRPARRGLIPLPTRAEKAGEWYGHCMLCVGYSDAEEVFIVRNSWGREWGDEGYCYIPYRYLMSSSNRDDSWIVHHVNRLEPDRATWHDDGVLDSVDTVLSKMAAETYTAMLEAMGEHHFEVRLALLFLRSAGADREFLEGEYTAMVARLQPVLARMGGHDDAHGVLVHALGFIGDDRLLEESITLFARFLPPPDLAAVVSELRAVAGADGRLSEAEQAFVQRVARAWWVDGEPRA